jgi:hypothetical protein
MNVGGVGFHQNSSCYRGETALDATPPRLLLTVMFAGFTGQDSTALYPTPRFFIVPMNAPVDVT